MNEWVWFWVKVGILPFAFLLAYFLWVKLLDALTPRDKFLNSQNSKNSNEQTDNNADNKTINKPIIIQKLNETTNKPQDKSNHTN